MKLYNLSQFFSSFDIHSSNFYDGEDVKLINTSHIKSQLFHSNEKIFTGFF